ncbi:MAG: hypothetical protein A2826_02390 [Candidatus Doudnabacteria bacterium RIFCSPHIGHO2_01_FULL_43_23]|uniref:Uncharacterized protein n=1 Tax=Candidatus Doudnabacteria bacterium RIFCSPHIGHO2_01_FULL_43_23 TaxID=1817822 RepID=A0A1F5NRK9_9BACT|nr:MAG: hypothetical protein A2826_02390 [Candidatus Doudnabacteria bacterium RIFCSPHIGHO2_01_FULL_43_23]
MLGLYSHEFYLGLKRSSQYQGEKKMNRIASCISLVLLLCSTAFAQFNLGGKSVDPVQFFEAHSSSDSNQWRKFGEGQTRQREEQGEDRLPDDGKWRRFGSREVVKDTPRPEPVQMAFVPSNPVTAQPAEPGSFAQSARQNFVPQDPSSVEGLGEEVEQPQPFTPVEEFTACDPNTKRVPLFEYKEDAWRVDFRQMKYRMGKNKKLTPGALENMYNANTSLVLRNQVNGGKEAWQFRALEGQIFDLLELQVDPCTGVVEGDYRPNLLKTPKDGSAAKRFFMGVGSYALPVLAILAL